MRVRCQMACGHRTNGIPLLNAGITDLDEATLTGNERAFIGALVQEQVAEILDDSAPAPEALDGEEANTEVVEVHVEHRKRRRR